MDQIQVIKNIADNLSKCNNTEPGLLNGLAGNALFYACLYKHFEDETHLEKSIECIEDSLDLMQEETDNSKLGSLISGAPGIGWTICKLDQLEIIDGTELLADFDDLISISLNGDISKGYYDLFYGMLGKGIYFLERFPNKTAHAELIRIIDKLDQLSEHSDNGITWQDQFNKDIGNVDHSFYNLGLAHGISSIITFLSKALELGISTEKVTKMLESSTHWLMQHKSNELGNCYYPSIIENNKNSTVGNLSWCYGDMGISIALLAASRALNNSTLKNEAINVAVKAAKRDISQSTLRIDKDNNLIDSGICHGTAGLMHLFNRISEKTEDSTIIEAKNYWYSKTINEARNTKLGGISGYFSYNSINSTDGDWGLDPSLLGGASGIGLSLLSTLPNFKISWDNILLTN